MIYSLTTHLGLFVLLDAEKKQVRCASCRIADLSMCLPVGSFSPRMVLEGLQHCLIRCCIDIVKCLLGSWLPNSSLFIATGVMRLIIIFGRKVFCTYASPTSRLAARTDSPDRAIIRTDGIPRTGGPQGSRPSFLVLWACGVRCPHGHCSHSSSGKLCASSR
jgi:hypothetical protein